jgi:hypothetical protein
MCLFVYLTLFLVLSHFNKCAHKKLYLALMEKPQENLDFLRKLHIFQSAGPSVEQRKYVHPIGILKWTPDQVMAHQDSSKTVQEYYRTVHSFKTNPDYPCIEAVFGNNTVYFPLDPLFCYPSLDALEILKRIK